MFPLIPKDEPAPDLGLLAMAERHVRQGARHVERQKEILERMAELGGDLAMATALLEEFELTLAQHTAHRNRLRAGLRPS